MSPRESDKPKTTNEKRCPECKSENVVYLGGVGVTSSERPPDPTHHLHQCQDCKKYFWYAGPLP